VSSAKLYTPELLGLAVELARHPLDASLPHVGEARSPACGSTLAVGLALDPAGSIERIGLRARACAVGQAAAAIFARHAPGRDAAQIDAAHLATQAWLEGEGALPDWPDLALIEPARAFPARHGAILLPWKAAACALSTVPAAR